MRDKRTPTDVCGEASYTAVFSVVTQRSWGRALRDDSKNGCVADYLAFCIQRSPPGSAKYACRIEAAPPDRDISITGLPDSQQPP